MRTETDKLVNDLETCACDAEELIKATAGELNDKTNEARVRLRLLVRSTGLRYAAWVLVASAGCLASATVADLPELIVPQGVGVNIHFTRGHEKDLEMIAAAGIKWVRMDFGWASTERKKGEYDWSAYEELTANLEKHGVRPYYILDYSNPLYEEVGISKNPITGREQKDVASPQRPESVAAFARWAAAAARHFKERRIVWEIWNEPNITFWKPKPEVQQYTALALAACKAIREADPKATIVGPATSEMPLEFLERFFAAGALDWIDGVSVHPYRSYKKGPETALEDYQKLRALIARYGKTPDKKKLPILSGEWGYASHTKGVSLETQAAFLVRQQFVNVLAGVPISIWYDWKNDGPDPAEREHNFGTVTSDLQPKPAYTALQTFTRELNAFRIEQRLSTGTNDFLLLLRNSSGERKLAAWTTTDAHHGSVKLSGKDASAVRVVNWRGEISNVELKDGELHIEFTRAPAYCTLGRLNVRTGDQQ